jgi:hypothetical protein
MWMVPGGILWGFKSGHVAIVHHLHLYGWGSVGAVPASVFSLKFSYEQAQLHTLKPCGGLWGWSPH